MKEPEEAGTEAQPGFDARLGRLESIVAAREEGGRELEDPLER